MKRFVLTVLAMSAMSAVAFAQGGVGTWKGEVAGRGGGAPAEVTVMIERGADGLMGKWMQGDQEETLTEVTAEGNTVSFQRALAGRGGAGAGITLTYNGEIDGDQLTLNISFDGGGFGGGARGGGAPAGGGAPGGGARGGGGGRGGAPIVLTRQ